MGPIVEKTAKDNGLERLDDKQEFYFIRKFAFAIKEVTELMDSLLGNERPPDTFYGDYVQNFSYIVTHRERFDISEDLLDYLAYLLESIPDWLKDVNEDGVVTNCHQILDQLFRGINKRCKEIIDSGAFEDPA